MAGADKSTTICEPFASVLRSGRDEFNHRFAEARRLHPDLDAAAFTEFLSRDVDPLIRAVARTQPDRVAEVVAAAYDAGLELAGQKLVGPGARHRLIEEGWQCVLPAVAALVAAAPERVIRAVSNALHHLSTTPGAHPDQWITDLERLGPQCGDADTLLRLGQVAAWKAGLAHLRQSAITAANTLPTSLALAAVGAPDAVKWPEIQKRLLADPWFDPAAPATPESAKNGRLRVMAQVGAFRGFGGLFVEPPRVAAAGDHFLVRSGADSWLLTADLFGATLHRATSTEFDLAVQHNKLPPGLRITDSKLVWDKQRFEIPSLGKFTSAAANATTLAVTSELTHSVVLLALT